MQIVFYEDKYFYYFWKPAGIPSTFGKQECFLGFLLASKNSIIKDIMRYLDDMFGREQEYGLVNRLDNETAGLLYFAKIPLFKTQYKALQSAGGVEKTYIADVSGKLKIKNGKLKIDEESCINMPIAHHKFDDTKMVAVRDAIKDKNKIRGKLHDVETSLRVLYYDEERNISTLLVTIKKGIRHQIRCHLASIGYPIIGDNLYNKNIKAGEKLHLWSMGLKIE